MSECEKCQALLDLYIDHGLEADEILFVEQHLQVCAACQEALRAQQQTADLLALWAQEEVDVPQGFREALLARLDEAAPRAPRKVRPRFYRALPWAAAAVLLLALLPAAWGMLGADRLSQEGTFTSAAQVANQTAESSTAEQQTAAKDAPQSAQATAVPPTDAKQAAQAADAKQAVTPRTAQPKDALPAAPASPEPVAEPQASAPQLLVSAEVFSAETDGNTPMVATGEDTDAAAPAAADAEAAPSAMMLRNAAQETADIDWANLAEAAKQQKADADTALAELRQQYAAEATTELQQEITALEVQLAKLDKQLAAIAQEDYEAYQNAQQ